MVIKWKENKLSISWADVLILSAWLQGGLLYFIGIAINLITGSQIIADGVIFAYYGLLIVMSYKSWASEIRIADILFIYSLSLIVLFSYILNVSIQIYIEAQFLELILNVVPFYFLGLMIKQEKRTFDMLYWGSAVAVVINWLYVAVILGTGRQMQTDNLFISYSVLPHALMMLWYAMEKKRTINIVLAISALVFVLSMGARGPVLSCVVFVALYLVYSSKKSLSRRFVFIVLPTVLVCIILFSGAWEGILLWLRDMMVQLNLSTRVIDAVLIGAADGSNNARVAIYKIMLDYIKERPLTGYGIYSEWSMIGYTAHQGLLELWCHYGVVAGTLILLRGLWIMLQGYRNNVNSYSQVFIMLMVSFGVVRCIYAGSYLSDYIFLLIGFATSAKRMTKIQYSANKE